MMTIFSPKSVDSIRTILIRSHIFYHILIFFSQFEYIFTRDGGNPRNFRAAFGFFLRIRQKNRINQLIRFLGFFADSAFSD